MGIAMLVIGLVILTVLAILGVPIIVASVASSIFVLITSGQGILTGLTGGYMTSFANYVSNYYLIFVLGAIFGKMCEISGATESIARTVVNKFGEKYVVLGIIVAAAILGFGGVNLFVALFALYPLSMSLFKRADLPRHLFPGTYIAGAATFAMTSPFTPSTQNITPTSYLGTTLAAGVVPGLIGTVFCAVCVSIYMNWRAKKVKANGEHFVPMPYDNFKDDDNQDLPSLVVALLPLIILIILLNAFGLPVVTALFLGIVIAIIIYWKWMPHKFADMWTQISSGASNGISSLINTAATVGFGGVVSSAPAFATIATLIEQNAQNGNAYLTCAIAVAALAGVSGSASGGLGIAVPIVGEIFMPLGISADAIHRIAVVASSSLDSLPHNGFVCTCLGYSHCTHRESYFDIFVVSVLVTIVETFLVVGLYTMGLS